MSRINKQQIAERIKRYRDELGFTQRKLGDLTGLGENVISNIERGITFPSLEQLDLISEVLKQRGVDNLVYNDNAFVISKGREIILEGHGELKEVRKLISYYLSVHDDEDIHVNI